VRHEIHADRWNPVGAKNWLGVKPRPQAGRAFRVRIVADDRDLIGVEPESPQKLREDPLLASRSGSSIASMSMTSKSGSIRSAR
jgi:hypothetical protein